MNANELANLLEVDSWYKLVTREDIATMLRQQQAEIKDLKQQVAFLEDWRDTWRPFLKAIMGKVNEDFEGIEFSRVGIYELCKAILRKARNNG
jgi:hypothetical protein